MKNMMTSRERVQCALNHEKPDRVPFFLGVGGVTSLLVPANEKLMAHLGVQAESRCTARAFQYARLDEAVMARLGSDGRPLIFGPAPGLLRKDISPTEFVDEWGLDWQLKPGVLYYEKVNAPLRNASLADLDHYPWPDLAHPSRFVGVAEEARRLHDDTPYAIVALSGSMMYDLCWLLRGMDTWLMDLAADPDFAHVLLRKVTDLWVAGVTAMLKEVGPYIDLIMTSDDLGTTGGPFISTEMYRKLIKPYHAEFFAAIKKMTKAKIFFHCCGGVYPLIGDLIDAGVDLLKPVQVSGKNTGDTARLKREFGKDISFCGGIDTHHVLPRGTLEDVRAEVRRRIKDLGPGGGYVAAAVHCIQADVPIENVLAMCDEVAVSGRYPLAQ
jgi:uroporphyrinogen decarboxylase